MNKTYKIYIYIIVFVIIPLLLGASIYFLLSPETFVGNWLSIFLKFESITEIRDYLSEYSIVIFIKNYFCDFLWAFSLESAIFIFFIHKFSYYSIVISIVISFISEIIQKVHIISGTFDIFDIIIELSAILLSYFLLRRILNEKVN